MTLNELKKLVRRGEGPALEFKRSTAEQREALQTACAFLNGAGGKVVIGVKPDGTVVGQQVSDKTLREIAQHMQSFEPPVNIEIERIKVAPGLEALVLHVPGMRDTVPYVFEGKAYEQVHSTTRKMSQKRYEQLLLDRTHSKRRWENQPAEGITLKDMDREEVHRITDVIVSEGNLTGPAEKKLERLLDRLGVRENGEILRAAVILFGKRFLPNFPQCELMMARFKGTDKTEFMDQKSLRGPAFKLLEEAQIFCQRHLPLPGKIVPGELRRQDKPLIPPMALREILVNALIHRDYSIAGGSIHVAIFDDRLEVWSAGRLPTGITPEVLSKDHDSVPRNPIVADVFHRAGLIERWGRGTNRVIEQCRAAGIAPPTFREVGPSTVVTFKVPVRLVETPQDTPQVPDKYPTSTRQVADKLKLLTFCTSPRSIREMLSHMGLKDRETFMGNYLRPLLGDKLLAMTDPDSPQSPKQKYVATAKGLKQLK